MNRTHGFFHLGILKKLVLMNLLIFIVFTMIIFVVFLSFRNIETFSRTIIDTDVNQFLENAQLGRDLNGVFADTDLLMSTFLSKEEDFRGEASRIVTKAADLKKRGTNPQLKESLNNFTERLQTLFDQGAVVHGYSRKLDSLEHDLDKELTALEGTLSDKLVALVKEGKDVSILEQLSIIIPGYRETLLQISLQHARLRLKHPGTTQAEYGNKILGLLDDLHLRLRTLTASDPGIGVYGVQLMRNVQEYKLTTRLFLQAMVELQKLLNQVNEDKKKIATAMGVTDRIISQTAGHMGGDISAVMRSSGVFILVVSGGIIAFLGVFTIIFSNNNILRPMLLIRQGIESIRNGNLETRIQLNRNDEWCDIEDELNRMVRELQTSYSELQDSNVELELTQSDLESKVMELETEVMERKRAENALRQSDTMLRKIFEAIPDQLQIIDRDLHILKANWKGGYDYVPEEIRSQNPCCYEAFYGTDGPCEPCHTLEVFKTGKPVIVEKFNPRIGHVEIRAYPLLDDSGEVLQVLEHIRDINERWLAEEALRESEQRLNATIQGSPIPMFVIGKDQKIVYWNSALEQLSGTVAGEVVGTDRAWQAFYTEERPVLANLLASEDINAISNWYAGNFSKSGLIDEAYEVAGFFPKLGKGGKWLHSTAAALRDTRGNLIGAMEMVEDITDRKHLEEQLRHAQKMDAIGQLAGGVAHDFNNILTAIIGYGNLLQMKIGDDETLGKYINQIMYSAERAANLTNSLLAFSRKHIIDLKTVKVNEIIGRAEKLLSRLIREDIELRVVTGEDCMVRADSMQIEQVLMNLVTNARDSMPEGGRLTISTEQITLDEDFVITHGYGVPGTFVLIAVSDTGSGMDEEIRERIFEPFFTTKETGKGTGLGLAIVYGIVKQHEGYINVYSEPGKGTTFKIYLPLVEGDGVKMELAETKAVPRGSEIVLLAEDEPVVRTLTKSVLEEFGYTVIEAEDGADAVDKFQENKDRIQLIILDVIMPRKNGKEAYDIIKMIRPDIKALFMSGYAGDILSSRGILNEKLCFVSKPFTQSVLLQKVREVLDN